MAGKAVCSIEAVNIVSPPDSRQMLDSVGLATHSLMTLRSPLCEASEMQTLNMTASCILVSTWRCQGRIWQNRSVTWFSADRSLYSLHWCCQMSISIPRWCALAWRVCQAFWWTAVHSGLPIFFWVKPSWQLEDMPDVTGKASHMSLPVATSADELGLSRNWR